VSSLWGENLEVFNSVYLKSGMIKSGGIWWGIIVQDNSTFTYSLYKWIFCTNQISASNSRGTVVTIAESAEQNGNKL
jgi:hypothetical protein